MKATNASAMKEKNKRLILNLIRENCYSRADIARKTNLTKAAVTIITEDLINDGMISETMSDVRGVGRKPLLLRLNPGRMLAVGLNITRTYAELGIVDICGNVVCENKFDVYPKNAAIKSILSDIEKMVAMYNINSNYIYGIGVTAPGPVDVLNNTILNPPNFDEWHYENIGSRLNTAMSVNVYLENIAGGMALYEKYYGKARNMDNILVLVVDDGVGSGIMTSGKLLRSISELGHTSIAYNGRRCKCGNYGCVEEYASIPSILKGTGYSSWKDAVDNNDEKLIEKEAEYLACAIINATNLFSVENVILGGGINYKTEVLKRFIETKIKRNRIVSNTPEIFSGSDCKGTICAAVTVFDHYFGIY